VWHSLRGQSIALCLLYCLLPEDCGCICSRCAQIGKWDIYTFILTEASLTFVIMRQLAWWSVNIVSSIGKLVTGDFIWCSLGILDSRLLFHRMTILCSLLQKLLGGIFGHKESRHLDIQVDFQ